MPAVGRPFEIAKDSRVFAKGDVAGLTRAIGGANNELIFARRLTEIRDPRTVGRPGHSAFGKRGRVREIARTRAGIGRYDEHIATRFDGNARPRRR